jgi:hypothetical protein
MVVYLREGECEMAKIYESPDGKPWCECGHAKNDHDELGQCNYGVTVEQYAHLCPCLEYLAAGPCCYKSWHLGNCMVVAP